MNVKLSRRALSDLREIDAYLRQRNPDAAFRTRASFAAALDLLVVHPHAGESVTRGLRRLVVAGSPYLIFYKADGAVGRVAIVTIRHSARKPWPPSGAPN